MSATNSYLRVHKSNQAQVNAAAVDDDDGIFQLGGQFSSFVRNHIVNRRSKAMVIAWR